eukprot:6191176-Pleurochrysis_carterae.AAC.2
MGDRRRLSAQRAGPRSATFCAGCALPNRVCLSHSCAARLVLLVLRRHVTASGRADDGARDCLSDAYRQRMVSKGQFLASDACLHANCERCSGKPCGPSMQRVGLALCRIAPTRTSR